ncbi:MAG: hypothetical protein WCT52_00095 [Candidatus Micrarchaeia archaeon]
MAISKQPRLLLIALLALAVLSAGCVLYDYRTGDTISNLEKMGITNQSVNLTPDNICAPLNVEKPCFCMVCKNDTHWYNVLSFLGSWFDADLKGGECRFDACNMTTFTELLESDGDDQPRAFMIGHGPSFASTASAFPYCNFSLQMATKWMKSPAQGATPRTQNPARAACWLERNVLPVYMYYTNGSAISPSWMGTFARSLHDNDAYPSLIVTEINFNSSDLSAMSNVKQQIVQIKQNCPGCLSVLGVRSGDSYAVNEILSDPTLYGGRNLSSMTDIVGFGFLANDYQYCDPARILASNIAFSRFVLSNHSKPTIWLYAGASEGNNSDGSCYFSNQTVHDFYQKAFAAIPGLVSSGVIGMSFYEYADRTGPLPCAEGEGCDYGIISSDGGQKHPEMNTWADLCQFVATDRYRNPIMFSQNGKGFVCDMFQNWKIYTQISTQVNTEQGLKTSEVLPMPKVDNITCGEVCISGSKNPKPGIYDNTGKGFDSAHCVPFPQIENYADDLDFSSTYFRAIIEQESGFNASARACVNLTNYNCNYNAADGSYKTVAQVCADAGIAPENCPEECPSGQKPCGMGLAQCIDMPGTVPACGGAAYNPFNAGMSICCGANKFAQYLSAATNFINSHWDELSACEHGMNSSEKSWAAYYLASNTYYGAQGLSEAKFQSFLSQRNGCAGQQHYIKYLRDNDPLEDPGNSYGADVMSRYFEAVNKCDSDCPGK